MVPRSLSVAALRPVLISLSEETLSSAWARTCGEERWPKPPAPPQQQPQLLRNAKRSICLHRLAELLISESPYL
jgi:hypothetical protein